ncbi:hypothetical protein ABZ635_22650 [Nocardiopsis sp. NPDC007018]|uniref:hypothetical protein n=1 Tax=Nocardiopsis sp. NPDC007018 TaxID=3155721 RepID=UPI0033CE7CD1
MPHPTTSGARGRRPVRHRPTVYRVRCTPGCTASFESRFSRQEAADDRRLHLDQVAPPASERCRDPRSHCTQPHDHCPVCANQMSLPLPGFEDVDGAHPIPPL